MTNPSKYESRRGSLSCTPGEFYGFITDIRNFEQFIPAGTVKNWQASAESCSFYVSPMGDISMKITGKTPFTQVTFEGNAFKNNEFLIEVNISGNEHELAETKLTFLADLNPVLKMMASAYIARFLDTLMDEMEKFRNWKV
jgi:hypothetical protein